MEQRRLSSACENRNFDVVMERVGYEGKFHMQFNIIFNFLLVIAVSMPYLNIILALAIPDHWCHVPGREQTNYTIEEWKNFTLPTEVDIKGQLSTSKCKMYNISQDRIEHKTKLANEEKDYNLIDCQYGWDFDRTWYEETVPSEGEWVCEKEIFVANAFAFGRIGDVVGTFTFGQLGDTIGRRPVFFLTLITLIVGRTMLAFSAHNYSLFLFATLLGSLSSTAVFQAPVIIAMEVSEEKKRAYITMLQCIGWTIGICLMPLILWAWGHWYQFILTTTLPCAIFLFSAKLMIESPRWLASQGKTARCIRQLEKIAKMNGTKVPSDAMITLRQKNKETEKAYGILSLFSSWRLAKNTALLLICWINGALMYYVIILNVNSLGGNPFMNFFWQGAAELPAYILARIFCDKIGRRWSQVVPFTIGAVACALMTIFITDEQHQLLITALAAFIKFCVSFAFYATNLLTLEIYPTCVRQSGLSLGSISASAFGILGPYIVYLGTSFNARYPPIVLTILSLTGAFSAAFLPETLHNKLPETLADAQIFGAHQKFWTIPEETDRQPTVLRKC